MSSTHQSTSTSSGTPVIPAADLQEQEILLGLTQNWNNIENGIFNWAQGAYNGLNSLTDPLIQDQINTSHMMTGAAQQQLQRYQNIFQPAENQLAGMANSYNSAARQQQEMGAAEARAQMGNQAARNQSISALEGMGVDPSSGRYAALDRAANLQGAAIATGAANQARENVQATGRQLLGQTVQVGQAIPNQVANYANTGVQAGNAASQTAMNRTALGSQMMNQPGQTEASLLGATKYAPTGQQTSSQSQSTGFGVSPLQVPKPLFPDDNGGGGGHGTGTNPDEVGGSGGGANPTFGQTGGGFGGSGGGSYAFGGPVRLDRRGGGHVPAAASPSSGTQTDDVPARLNADEFVIPRDVTHHLGTKYFQNLIQNSRKLRGAPQQPIGPTMKRV